MGLLKYNGFEDNALRGDRRVAKKRRFGHGMKRCFLTRHEAKFPDAA